MIIVPMRLPYILGYGGKPITSTLSAVIDAAVSDLLVYVFRSSLREPESFANTFLSISELLYQQFLGHAGYKSLSR